MQNAGFMRCGQRVGDADEKFDNLAPRSSSRARPFAERAAVHELGDEILAILFLAGVVDGDDVRVVERRGHARFLLEAAAR